MTCEVAVMNNRGVAVAADSAVTLSAPGKVFNRAEKLFQFGTAPIAVMVYGNADMMGVPWETVIKTFTQQRGDQRFDHVDQYAQDLFRFIEQSYLLSQVTRQREQVQIIARACFCGIIVEICEKISERKGINQDPNPTILRTATKREIAAILSEVIDEIDWGNIEDENIRIQCDQLLTQSASYLHELEEELEQEFFGSRDYLPERVKERIKNVCRHMYARSVESTQSGVVVMGIGESELFPVLIHYLVTGIIIDGNLHVVKLDEAQCDQPGLGYVFPFAQGKIIDMFFHGIHPDLFDKIPEETKYNFAVEIRNYRQPLMEAVSALPLFELAQLAEALVNLTALSARVSTAEQIESVGGPIDVAVISKGDGFKWVKKS